MKLSKPVIILGAVAAAVVIALISVFSYFNGIQKDMVSRETALSAAYSDNQNELSAFIRSIKEQTGLAKVKSDKLDKVLSDAVRGRYEGKTAAQPGQGMLFSAITEAYPEIKGLDIYDQIVVQISAGRSAFKNKQSKLLDMLRDYDTWKDSGLLRKQFVSLVGAPSNSLKARVGDTVLTGQAAEDKMWQLVLAKEAQESFQTGEDTGLDFSQD